MHCRRRLARRACRTRSTARSRRSRSAAAGRLGDAGRPLLVSVRCGAAVLDARDDGHDPQPRPERRGRRGAGRARRATRASPTTPTAASLQMFGDVVEGVDGARLRGRADAAQAPSAARSRRRPHGRRPARARAPSSSASTARARRRLPAGPARAAAAARSTRCSAPGTRRARTVYRRAQRHLRRPRHGRQRLPDGVRQPRRRARAPASASRATRRPASTCCTASSCSNAQGEDVVAGIRTPEPIARMHERAARGLRRAGRDGGAARARTTATCRTSSSPSSSGTLYLLQTRTGKRTAQAALRIARDLVAEGVIDARRGACCRDRPARSSTSCCTRASTRGAASSRSRAG